MLTQILTCIALLTIPVGGCIHAYAADMRSRGINPW